MSSLELVLAGILILVLFGAVFVGIFGIPGTIFIFFTSLVYATFTGFESLGVKTLILLLFLAVIAEAIDFSVRFITTFYLGFSITGFFAALLGAVVGMAMLTPFLMGLGTLLGFFWGSFAGLVAVELIRQARLKPVFRAKASSIVKRLCATALKGSISVAMVLITMIHIYS